MSTEVDAARARELADALETAVHHDALYVKVDADALADTVVFLRRLSSARPTREQVARVVDSALDEFPTISAETRANGLATFIADALLAQLYPDPEAHDAGRRA
jgi:hypothetical protein